MFFIATNYIFITKRIIKKRRIKWHQILPFSFFNNNNKKVGEREGERAVVINNNKTIIMSLNLNSICD